MIIKEVKEPILKHEDVVFDRNDSFDDDITTDDNLSDVDPVIYDNMSDTETTISDNLSEAETEFYDNLSEAETIDYTSDIEFIKKIPQHPNNRMKRKRADKIKQEKLETNKDKPKNKENIRQTIKNVFDAFEDERIKKEEENKVKKELKKEMKKEKNKRKSLTSLRKN